MCHRVSLLEHLPLMFEAMFVLINTSEFLEEKCLEGFWNQMIYILLRLGVGIDGLDLNIVNMN